MVSIVVRGPKALEVESANVPEPKANEVVVKVRRAGICGCGCPGQRNHQRSGRYALQPCRSGRAFLDRGQCSVPYQLREAFDLIEKNPQRTLKVQLDFS